jgi:hypothetical protein
MPVHFVFGLSAHLQDMQLISQLRNAWPSTTVNSRRVRHPVVMPQALRQTELIHNPTAAAAAAVAVTAAEATKTWCLPCKH